jgi:hypothetical protein
MQGCHDAEAEQKLGPPTAIPLPSKHRACQTASGPFLSLSIRMNAVAPRWALGETTGRVARSFRISAARVSQLRRELCENWHRFVDELADAALPSAATAAAC